MSFIGTYHTIVPSCVQYDFYSQFFMHAIHMPELLLVRILWCQICALIVVHVITELK